MSLSTFTLLHKQHQCPSAELFSPSQGQTLNPLNVTPHPLPFSGNHPSTFYLYGSSYSRYFIQEESYNICSFCVQFGSVQSLSRVQTLQPHEPQHARLPCPSPTPGVYPNTCPLSRWYHPTISSSVAPFSSCPQSFPASGSFQMSQLFTSDVQSIGVSASTSVLPMNTQGWSPLGWTGWISLQSKGLSRVFSNTTVQKHQFFNTQLSLESNSHIHTFCVSIMFSRFIAIIACIRIPFPFKAE